MENDNTLPNLVTLRNFKTRILIVVPNDCLGGAEQLLKMIANHFEGDLVEIIFLTRRKTNQWDVLSQKAKLSYSKHNSQYIGALWLTLSFLFKRKKAGFQYIFTSHVFITGLIGLLIRIRLIKKDYFIGRESTHIFKRFRGFKLMIYKLMYKFGYPSLDLLICQTDDMKQELIKSLPKLKEVTNIVVIPNPFDFEEIANKSISLVPEHLGRFIVSAGRLIPEKGFDILIDAFSKIVYEYPEIKLMILGEGNQRDYLKKLIKEKKLEDKVVLYGFTSDVYSYFRVAEVCVVSSRIEGFPNVLLQMMSQNNKIVSTTCAGGIEDIPGIFIASVNDKNSLAIAMIESLKTDTTKNRILFDNYLKGRTIENYFNAINQHLIDDAI